jgi:hypothetical protein
MSGTTISNLPAAGSVGVTDLFVKVALGSPNVTQRCTTSQVFAALSGQTIAGPLSVTNPGTASTEVTTFAQFAPSAASSGYIHLPGGVTMQWGSATTSGALAQVTITFPVGFSGTPWTIQALINNTPEPLYAVASGNATATTAVFWTWQTSTSALTAATFYWFAIGPT